ncbi:MULTISPECIES: hypothetical protein [unclassified Aureimonas]|uniref:hypothetical protein n=1 Tax=unclassified Aureimonas TaxID=2615206 RepID=UPI000700525B|nr:MULTISPECIES: hypothetical protein [unclassified Aureimonas]KQT62071.1 hypothetical protein ASG62_23450 [Aureimonas sp. Leaf427]KQT72349.1 hypothetical protein ASG54_18600 [Aureimonas sp. Leaf460]
MAGLRAGGVILALARTLFAHAHSVGLRFTIAIVFAAPAFVAGYSATLGLSQFLIVSSGWQTTIAVTGAIMVGGAAWGRIVATPPSGTGQSSATGH